MKLNSNFLRALGAKDGAGSTVTADEFNKQQVTLVKDEKEVLFKKLPKNRIFRGKVGDGGTQSQQPFILYTGANEVRSIRPNLVFPKPKKDELRLYLSEGEFNPDRGAFFYVFIRKDNRLCLGWCMPNERILLENGWLSPTAEIADTASFTDAKIEGSDLVERIKTSILARRGQAKFRKALRRRYADTCCISGSTTVAVLEAAHIEINVSKDNHSPSNGLLLRSDLHTLFDLGLIAIEPDSLRIRIHPTLEGTEYEGFEGRILDTQQHRVNEKGIGARWMSLDWTN